MSFPIVGIGASAGGLESFSELIALIPASTGMAYVFVQHLDPGRYGSAQVFSSVCTRTLQTAFMILAVLLLGVAGSGRLLRV